MLSGNNTVYYEKVEAYSVNTRSSRLISGGFGDEVTVTQGTTFLWVYDPNGPSGFSGQGWFTDVENTPLHGVDEEELKAGFANETITNLDSYFQEWQSVVAAGQSNGFDYVRDFVFKVGEDCVSFV